MCGSMVDIQSATAEIRRGKKKKKEQTTGWKYIWPALLHRAAINEHILQVVNNWMASCRYCSGFWHYVHLSLMHCRWQIQVRQMMRALQHCTILSVLVTLMLLRSLLSSDVMLMLPTQMDGASIYALFSWKCMYSGLAELWKKCMLSVCVLCWALINILEKRN